MYLKSTTKAICSVLALTVSCAAHARDQEGTVPAPAPIAVPAGVAQTTGAVDAAADPAADAASTGDIIVTAQKRSESLQRVPAAVSVVNNERLAKLGVTNLTQVGNLTSGLSVTPVRTQAFIFIRGVGQTLTSPNADAAVAVNLNGVYLPAEIAGTAFFDVERIEILPGPQGTLYGRNSTGGVVNITTRAPGDDFGADGFVEYGNYNRVQAVLGVDIPLSDGLTSRTAGTIIRRDGYMTNGVDAQETWSVRQTLVWNPVDGTRITAVGTYTQDTGQGQVFQNIPVPACGARCATYDPDALGHSGKSTVAELSFQVDHSLTDNVDLVYIGGYNRLDLDRSQTIFNGPVLAPLTIKTDIEAQSHELRLHGTWGASDGILGVYYFDQDSYYFQDARPTPAQRLINPFNGGSKGAAVFGQGTYLAADNVRLTGGLRYSHTKKEIDGFNSTYNAAGALLALRPFAGKSTLKRVDWKVGLEFDLTPASMLYANVSTGFSPGGFSTGPALVGQLPAAPFKPVSLRAYASGIKNRLFDGLLTLNLEGFYYDYKDYQVSARDILTAQNLVFNAEKATVYGAQLDARFNPTGNDTLSVSATWLHAVADRLRTPTGRFDGFDLPYSPKWTINAFYEHSFDVGNDAQIRGSSNLKYTSSRWSLFTHQTGSRIGGNTNIDLNLGYFAAKNRWSVQGFVRNATDALVKTTCGNTLPGPTGCFFDAPRTYGATVSFKY